MNYLRNEWDRVGAWLCVTGGLIALFCGYLGVSGTLETGKQLPYVVSGGLFGLFLLGLGVMLWLSADLRDEWRKLDAIERRLEAGGDLPEAQPVNQDRPLAAADAFVPHEVALR